MKLLKEIKSLYFLFNISLKKYYTHYSFHSLQLKMNLSIQLNSFELSKDLIQPNDRIHINVTTFPGEQHYALNIDLNKIEETRPVFTIGINEMTKKIIIVFRKKTIIASTIIRSEEFPNKLNDKYNSEMRNILLCEPFPKDPKNNHFLLENRKVLGKMEAQFALTDVIKSRNNTIRLRK